MSSKPVNEEEAMEPESVSVKNKIDENCNISDLSTKEEFVKLVSEGVKLSVCSKVEIESDHFLRVLIRRWQYEVKNQEERDKELGEQMQAWKEEENRFKCIACENFSSSPDVPANLRKTKRGNYGFCNKTSQRNDHINESIRAHNALPLHKWCYRKWTEGKIRAKEKDDQETTAAMNLVRNCIYCLKKVTGSSHMLVELQSMNFSMKQLTATKNDSKAMYFMMRTIVERKLRERIKSIFKKVRFISLSLDKITLDGECFTPIIVFFFNEGSLEVLMAELFVNASGIFRVTGDI